LEAEPEVQMPKEVVKAEILELTWLGKLSLGFNNTMLTQGINFTSIDSEIVEMFIVPAEQREQNDGFRMESINFTWKAVEYVDLPGYGSKMVFMLTFNEPE
jgi:hypothetical protein